MDNTNVQRIGKKGSISTKNIAVIGLSSALAFLLMFVKFPISFLGFLELELSGVPAIVCGLIYGPVAGVLVELIKNLIHLTATSTVAVGELANFLVSASYILGLTLIVKHTRFKNKIIVGFGVGTVAMVISGIIVNYFISIPMYIELFFGGNDGALYGMAGSMVPAITDIKTLLLLGISPFNLVKGIITSIAGYYVYRLLKNRIA